MKPRFVSLFLAGLVFSIAGCGSQSTITGTVTYRGSPIPSGSILFVPENGAAPVHAPINDGKYTAENVAVGPAKIIITSLHSDMPQNLLMANMRLQMGPPPNAAIPAEVRQAVERSLLVKNGFSISPRYADPEQSGLTCTVESGRQTKDFQLE